MLLLWKKQESLPRFITCKERKKIKKERFSLIFICCFLELARKRENLSWWECRGWPLLWLRCRGRFIFRTTEVEEIFLRNCFDGYQNKQKQPEEVSSHLFANSLMPLELDTVHSLSPFTSPCKSVLPSQHASHFPPALLLAKQYLSSPPVKCWSLSCSTHQNSLCLSGWRV